jgi:eukaryotic-like serine/threonine-protein kinase
MTTADPPNARAQYEFGPFRASPDKGLLVRGAELVPLTPKAFHVLMVLIEHAPAVVTKDDLLKAVWPDTFVEEGNLSRTVFMLRKALDESPQDRFIVTVQGQGYRFAEQVRRIDGRPEAPGTPAPPPARSHELPPNRPPAEAIAGKRPFQLAALLLLVVAIAGLGLISRRRDRPPTTPLSDTDTIVLADFSNTTGDAVFDVTLRDGLAVQLQQSPFLRIESDQRVHHMLQLMQQPADVALTGEIAREACERAGAAAVVQGSISALGARYVIGLDARGCRSGERLDAEQAQAAGKEDVLPALSELVGRLRARLGENLASVEQHTTRLDEATTSSLEALRAYSAGRQVLYSHGASASMPFFQRAVELDPGFAMAHASLGRAFADLDQSDRAASSLERAWQLRARASEPERYFLTALYQVLATGNNEAAQETCDAWARTYPRDARPHALLSGSINKNAGRYNAGLAEARLVVAADPDLAIGYYSVGVNNQYLGHLKEAHEAIATAEARGLDIDEFAMLRYELAFLDGDPARLERTAAAARARAGGDNWMSAREAFVAAYAGHLDAARALSDRAVAQAVHAGQSERAGLWQAGAAVREALFGEAAEAARRAAAALTLSRDRETTYGAALAFGMSGDSARTKPLVADLAARFPEDTSVQFSALPVLRAQLALNSGKPELAVQALQAATEHELGVPRSTVSALFGALYPVYLRGEAYLMLRRGTDAAAEFQKIIDHRTIVASDPVGALARLQLGRAHALAGNAAEARTAYRDVLELWRDADVGMALLKRAHAEHTQVE